MSGARTARHSGGDVPLRLCANASNIRGDEPNMLRRNPSVGEGRRTGECPSLRGGRQSAGRRGRVSACGAEGSVVSKGQRRRKGLRRRKGCAAETGQGPKRAARRLKDVDSAGEPGLSRTGPRARGRLAGSGGNALTGARPAAADGRRWYAGLLPDRHPIATPSIGGPKS